MTSWVIAFAAAGMAYFAHTAKTRRGQWWSLLRINFAMWFVAISTAAKDYRYLVILGSVTVCASAGLGLIQFIRRR